MVSTVKLVSLGTHFFTVERGRFRDCPGKGGKCRWNGGPFGEHGFRVCHIPEGKLQFAFGGGKGQLFPFLGSTSRV